LPQASRLLGMTKERAVVRRELLSNVARRLLP
jgi:hypothetical protein